TWQFLAIADELPNPGDYKTTFLGETPVIVTRGEDGAIHAMVNRCAHRGNLVCLKRQGNADLLTCVYHSWSYDLAGNLKSVAFRRGIGGKGGMPDTFKLEVAHPGRQVVAVVGDGGLTMLMGELATCVKYKL